MVICSALDSILTDRYVPLWVDFPAGWSGLEANEASSVGDTQSPPAGLCTSRCGLRLSLCILLQVLLTSWMAFESSQMAALELWMSGVALFGDNVVHSAVGRVCNRCEISTSATLGA